MPALQKRTDKKFQGEPSENWIVKPMSIGDALIISDRVQGNG